MSSVSAFLEILANSMRDLFGTRYLSGIGFVVLAYDHCLCLNDEIVLVWKAKSSFARTAFLFNKYIVVLSSVIIAWEINGFSGPWAGQVRLKASSPIAVTHCASVIWIPIAGVLGIISQALANLLLLLRIYSLWDHRKKVMLVTLAVYLSCFLVSISFIGITIHRLRPEMVYSGEPFRTCVLLKKSSSLSVAWGVPILFDVFMVCSTVLNAFDRPRGVDTKLTRLLLRDGVLYHVVSTHIYNFVDLIGLIPTSYQTFVFLRLFNFSLSMTSSSSTVLMGSYFVWAMITATLNRMILTSRNREENASIEDLLYPEDDEGVRSNSTSKRYSSTYPLNDLSLQDSRLASPRAESARSYWDELHDSSR
ncbi:hypothetical protein SISNIDRAFT_491535 [Sistotremastrum niveocremeum HHB9708]|uniref:DUF6533 domain-containing protein n=1 Tax=Sistotremastrum niveocremeum HHB9708 TaxID=1314777 RepID=A0A164MPS5_9AGAM|nr:hypothetical protein SISNIDRAFT_491535 [Sistotremastrum niveocremeum HHB9708]